MADILTEIADSLIEGDAPRVKKLTEKALKDGVSPEEIINKGLIKGMDVIGIRFRDMEISVPEVLISARAMHAGLEILKPFLTKHNLYRGKFLIGTVKGDIHDIGKNLVSMMMEGAGFKVYDLGVDVPPEKFVEAVKKYKPDIVGMSALLSVTMQNMKDVVEALKREGLREKVKIIVGGAPASQEFADEIGADAYGRDARDTVEKALKLMDES